MIIHESRRPFQGNARILIDDASFLEILISLNCSEEKVPVILEVCGRFESNGSAPKDAESTREGGLKSGNVEVLKARWTKGSSFNENPLFILNVEVFFLDLPEPFPLKSFESAFG